jgi:transmembrane sensor
MDSQRETIYQLLMLKLTDSLTESEEGYINSLIESDPEVYILWNEIRADFAAPRHKEALQSFDTGEMLLSVTEEVKRRKHRRQQRKRTLFFTLVVLLGAGVFGLYKGADNKKDLSDNVVLQLSNGEQIALSDSSIDQMTGDKAIEIRSNNNTLAYTVNKRSSAIGTISVPAGKSYRIQLSDGTDVRMNSGSKMMFPFSFSGSKREITLSGEAFLNVAPNPRLPFIVHTQHTSVQVLGTSFNVNSYDSGVVTVSLLEGVVKINEILLKPGYRARVSSKGIDTIPFEEEIDLAWLKDQYIFRHSRMDEVIPVLARWYNVKIVFDNQTAAGKVVTGHIVRSDEIKTVLDMLKIISNINYYYKEDIIHIQ